MHIYIYIDVYVHMYIYIHLFNCRCSEAAGRLRIDTWPIVVGCKASPYFLENYRLNAPVDVGGRDFL